MNAALPHALAISVTPLTALPGTPASSSDSLALFLVLAAGVTALVAVALVAVLLHREARLTARRGRLSVTAAIAVTSLTIFGMLSLTPTVALAAPADPVGSSDASRTGGPGVSEAGGVAPAGPDASSGAAASAG